MTVIQQTSKDILTLTIDRPASLNAINADVMGSLHKIFAAVDENTTLRGIIITGAGDRAFVAGADIKEFDFAAKTTEELGNFGHQTYDLIENCRVPVIAAVNGFALGGGCELAMACHMRIASSNAKFGQPEINLGIIPGYGGTQRLPRLIGKGRAMEMLLTADLISADQALTWGLVNHVVEPGEAVNKAREVLEKIAGKAPLAAAAIIRLINQHYTDPIGAMQREPQEFAACFTTEDAKEGVKAFIDKRKPHFKGR